MDVYTITPTAPGSTYTRECELRYGSVSVATFNADAGGRHAANILLRHLEHIPHPDEDAVTPAEGEIVVLTAAEIEDRR